jgi:hypothetical protein
MLSHLDRILFPDRCEVIEIEPSQRYVYPIFKNGSSSLRIAARKNNWRIKINEQIAQLDNIDIVIRRPLERFISGINTYVQMTSRDNPTLDPATILWFAKNYLFLNKHYCPQLHWLLHLSRYIKSKTRLNFIGMDGIESITSLYIPPNDVNPVTPEIQEQLLNLKNNEMYLRIDEIIFNCIGQSMTVEELIQHIKSIDFDAYNYVIGHSQQILNPTYVLP